jgi:hypothetical protein
LFILVASASFCIGFAQRQTVLSRSLGTAIPNSRPFTSDHISLEPDLRTWHLTAPQSQDHEGRFPTIDLGEGRRLWCGISVARFDDLREVRKEVVVEAPVPMVDAQRRINNFVTAREQLVFNTLQLNAMARHRFVPGFLHFTLVVGPCGFPKYSGPEFRLPNSSPQVRPPFSKLTDVPLRSHRVNIPPFDVEDIVSWLPGTLSVPVMFTT